MLAQELPSALVRIYDAVMHRYNLTRLHRNDAASTDQLHSSRRLVTLSDAPKSLLFMNDLENNLDIL